jgi:hypothetical protein
VEAWPANIGRLGAAASTHSRVPAGDDLLHGQGGGARRRRRLRIARSHTERLRPTYGGEIMITD